MSALTLRLANSLHEHLKEAAETDGVSVNQFISLAVAEKLASLRTYDVIANRASKADKGSFLRAMANVPKGNNVVEGDELRS